MRTLLDLLDRIQELDRREALRFSNGFRTWTYSYRQLQGLIEFYAAHLRDRGLGKGDRLVVWSENRPEWVALFWACCSMGIQIVPIDSFSSSRFVEKILRQVDASLLAHGETVDPGELTCPLLRLATPPRLGPDPGPLQPVSIEPDDVVQIVFTSGTSDEPKGVVHRHRNICANLGPIASEIDSYRRYARPFQPVRFLNLLPLSHMFGQAFGLYAPVLLGGAVVLMTELHPSAVIRVIRENRVSVLATVPRILSVLRSEISRRHQLPPQRPHGKGLRGIIQRWWRYRSVHADLGWKFWAFATGGAELDSEADGFWSRLGYLVMQGYGLTETSPVVAVNHPFNNRPGSIGKVVPGQEVRLAADGEILVRGPSVVRTYVIDGSERPPDRDDGWLHTGDIGELDSDGRLYFKGRKKDVIVTRSGMNVYPKDVETALNSLPGVVDSAVLGRKDGRGETVHAVLILADESAPPEALVRLANRQLESHQTIQGWSVWPQADFPRTASTFKVKRRLIASWLEEGRGGERDNRPSPLEDLLQAGEEGAVANDMLLSEDLGLSSLDRMELLSGLEDAYRIELDEERFATVKTVGEVREWIEAVARPTAPEPEASSVPETETRPARRQGLRPTLASSRLWYGRAARLARFLLLETAVLPAFRLLVEIEVEGRENLPRPGFPTIFAANHSSHFDTPTIFAALPPRLRNRLAPAMRQEYFLPHFRPRDYSFRERWTARSQFMLAAGLFAAYPLPQRLGGVRRTLRLTGRLVDLGFSPLIFPEGRRTPDGNMLPFQPGVGVMALRLGIPVTPIHMQGLFEIYSKHDQQPKAGKVRVRIGRPLRFRTPLDPAQAAGQVEKAVRDLDGRSLNAPQSG